MACWLGDPAHAVNPARPKEQLPKGSMLLHYLLAFVLISGKPRFLKMAFSCEMCAPKIYFVHLFLLELSR